MQAESWTGDRKETGRHKAGSVVWELPGRELSNLEISLGGVIKIVALIKLKFIRTDCHQRKLLKGTVFTTMFTVAPVRGLCYSNRGGKVNKLRIE